MISTALIRNCAPTAALAQQFAPRKQSIRQRYNPAAATLKRNFLRGDREGEKRLRLHVFFCALTLGFGQPHRVCVWLAAGLCRGRGNLSWYPTNLPPQTGTCLPSRRPLPRQGSLPGTRNSGDLSCTRPNFAGGRSRPQTGACLPLHRLRNPKQAPVYHRADCVAPNRRLFTIAQTA